MTKKHVPDGGGLSRAAGMPGSVVLGPGEPRHAPSSGCDPQPPSPGSPGPGGEPHAWRAASGVLFQREERPSVTQPPSSTGAGGWANRQERETIFTSCSGRNYPPLPTQCILFRIDSFPRRSFHGCCRHRGGAGYPTLEEDAQPGSGLLGARWSTKFVFAILPPRDLAYRSSSDFPITDAYCS